MKKIDSLLKDDIDLIREKTLAYCFLCTSFKKDAIDKNLFDRCEKYRNDFRNYNHIKNTLEDISRSRKKV